MIELGRYSMAVKPVVQAVQKFDDRTGKIQYGCETSGSGRSEV